ncbi:MAG: hypothetical protein QXY05_02105 [Candidatus Anstonellales archaeon]
MKVPKEIRTYCPKCKKHTVHTVKIASKGRASSLSFGTRKHEKKLKGHGGKRAGEKTVKKQGKRQKIILSCPECKKSHEKVLGTRTKKKVEIKR